jgi:type III secretory pathway component EscR
MKQPKPASQQAESRPRLASWVETPYIQYSIVVLIVINAITLGLETSPTVMAHAGSWLLALDNFILSVFVIEISIKLYAHRRDFFCDPGNVFDVWSLWYRSCASSWNHSSRPYRESLPLPDY